MTSDIEKYYLGQHIYNYIQENPMVSRSDINLEFKASSNDAQGSLITSLLVSMLTLGQVCRHRDDASNTVFFWLKEYRGSPYPADTMFKIINPVNVLGPPPAEQFEASVEPIAKASVPVATYTPEELGYRAFAEKLNGGLKRLYETVMEHPAKLFAKNDSSFVEAVRDSRTRAQSLGRLWSLGALRRGSDDSSQFYTLSGVYPPSLTEDIADLSKKAKVRIEKVNERVARAALIESLTNPPKAKDTTLEKTPVEEQEDEEDNDLALVEELSEQEDVSDPVAYMDSNFSFALLRESGVMLHFTEKENAALTQMILNININRLEAYHANTQNSD